MKVLLLVFVGIASASVIPDHGIQLQELSDYLKTVDAEDFYDITLRSTKTRETVPDMIASQGYPAESHYITTPDGYILNLHRIPKGKTGRRNKKVAFLQHGILASSSDWVLAGSGKALGYILADEGYDVWMGNVRGNTYSRNHSELNPDKDNDFWQFSWHQMGTTDLPAMIDYVLEQTGADGIYYVGHSQGTTVFYVMAATRPDYNDKIKAQVSLAPIGFMNHITSPLLKVLAFWEKPFSALLDLIGEYEFLPSNGFISLMGETLCSGGLSQILCENVLFLIAGFSPKQMNMTLLPSILSHSPAGCSTKQFLHYSQEIRSGKFRQYDWGAKQNQRGYGSITPPVYDLKEIKAPVYMIYSKNDWIAAERDVRKLCGGLSNCQGEFLVSDYSFNHLDFTYGIEAPKLIYNKIISLFSRH